MLRRLLAARGIHFLVTRFGPRRLRILAFDEKYIRGDWSTLTDGSGELPVLTRNYLHEGDLLIMGCGGSSVLSAFGAGDLNSALGVDLSPEAIRIASQYSSAKVAFEVADMTSFKPMRSFDVILFSESLYYIPADHQARLLRRLSDYLKPSGVYIATFAQPLRHRYILETIRQRFEVIEDRPFAASRRHLMVFRPMAPKRPNIDFEPNSAPYSKV